MGNEKNTQPDKNAAADERPVPSQAEGDRETVEEDLKRNTTEQKRTEQKRKVQEAGTRS
ncbi:MAG TPA: hypothetical protein VH325_16960 [Bryobacteraceae bacterium]|jgi:hypothetical protein|nr:hypothetical protein [Bryobacteraceae bacterium]